MTVYAFVFKYIAFSVVATIVNLSTQRVFFLFGENSKSFVLAIIAGTVLGLMTKYILDKRWIFKENYSGIREENKKFFKYALLGIITTLIFWSIEVTFWLIWKSHLMRELGAILGLTIGYWVKYNLDKRFVFKKDIKFNG